MNSYDVIVVGAGSGGLTTSLVAAEIGLTVLLIDKKEENLGGECLRSGCVPSKSLIHVANTLYSTKKSQEWGVTSNSSVNWQSIKTYIQQRQQKIGEKESREHLEQQGIHTRFGEAQLETPHRIDIDGEKYTSKKIILCTGSSPRRISLDAEIPVYTNEDIFIMDTLPSSLLIIGGGPIGLEIGQALSRLGSDVSIVERGNTILKRDPVHITNALKEQLSKEIDIYTDTTIETIEDGRVTLSNNHVMSPDGILLGIGRKPNTKGLGLDTVGVEYTKKGITVDEYCQTSVSSIYAVGDCNGKYQLSHVAELEASTVIQNALTPLFNKKVPYDNVSWVTYTDPQIATLGNTCYYEKDSSFTKHSMPFEDVDRTIIEDTPSKGVIYTKNGYIAGASIMHSRAESIIQEIVLAKQNNIKLRAFTSKIVPYPTHEMITKMTSIKDLQESTPTWIKGILKKLW